MLAICHETKSHRSRGHNQKPKVRHGYKHTGGNKGSDFVTPISIPRRIFVEVPMTFHGDARNPGQDRIDDAPDRGDYNERDDSDPGFRLLRFWVFVEEAKVLEE